MESRGNLTTTKGEDEMDIFVLFLQVFGFVRPVRPCQNCETWDWPAWLWGEPNEYHWLASGTAGACRDSARSMLIKSRRPHLKAQPA